MKKLILLGVAVIVCYAACHGQTSLPASTTVYDFSKMPNGFYRIVNAGDTADVLKDSTFCPVVISLYNIFTTQKPSGSTESDGQAITLGVKFKASKSGFITGVKFYKTSGNNGNHIGQLYDRSGGLLWTAPFTNETATGWQTALFATPIAINSGTTYVAAVFSSQGFYVSTQQGFSTAITNGVLTGLASGTDGVNGVYNYGSSPKFPTLTYNKSNYWVDVILRTN